MAVVVVAAKSGRQYLVEELRGFLWWHRLRRTELVLVGISAILTVYKLVTLVVPAPTLPPELLLPALTVILAALYLTEKWRAWTGTPALRMDSTIEKDPSVGCFRLRLWNDRLPACKPRVIVEGVVNNHGKVLAQAMPLELEWTHHPGERAELSPQDVKGETVAIVILAPWPWQER